LEQVILIRGAAPQHHLRAVSGHKRSLIVMHHDRERPNTRRVQSASAGRAVDDHGRVVTANFQAAAFYRQAQQAVDTSATVEALRHAVTADPGFGLAVADLDALTETSPAAVRGRQTSWERHHIEVINTAVAGNVSRATDLLREHLAIVGCDPLALRILIDVRRRTGNLDELADFSAELPGCHRAPRWTLP
jgi:hypothetical protein